MVANWELMAPSLESMDACMLLRKAKNSGWMGAVWMGAVVEAAAAVKRVESAAAVAAI